jgi:DHA2 family multidrug resistance protein
MLIFSMGMMGSTFLLPLYLQNAMDYTATQSGAVFLPVGILQGMVSPLVGMFSDKANPKVPIIVGVILLAFSFYINSDLSYLTEHSYIMTALYIRGFAMGMIFTPLSTLSLLTISHEAMAQASSITNTVRQIGSSLGVAIFNTILTARIIFHTKVYGEMMNTNSPEYRNIIQRVGYFVEQNSRGSFSAGLQQGKSMIASFVSKQAFIQGISDDFLIACIISIVGVIPIFIVKSKKKEKLQTVNNHPEHYDFE